MNLCQKYKTGTFLNFWIFLEICEHFLNFSNSCCVIVGLSKFLSVRVAGYPCWDCSNPSVPNRSRVQNRPGLQVQSVNFRDSKFRVWFSFCLQVYDLFWTFSLWKCHQSRSSFATSTISICQMTPGFRPGLYSLGSIDRNFYLRVHFA